MRRSPRASALALAGWMLLCACVTEAPQSGRLTAYRYPAPPAPGQLAGRQAPGTNPGRADNVGAVFVRLPTDFGPVKVGEAEFTSAVTTLMLHLPLRVASTAPVRPGGGLAPGSGGSGGETWQSGLARSYGGFCERRGTCLSLFDDGSQFQADDKLKMALALAVGPALEGVATQLRATFNPDQVLATVTLGITAYMALWLAPDPVMTKGIAAASTLLLWGYLGSELFELLRAYVRLSEEAARASTFAELQEAGEHSRRPANDRLRHGRSGPGAQRGDGASGWTSWLQILR